MVQSSMVSDIVAIHKWIRFISGSDSSGDPIHKGIRFIRGSDIAESVSVDIVVTYE